MKSFIGIAVLLFMFCGCRNNSVELIVSPDGKEGNTGLKESPVPDIYEAIKIAESIIVSDPGAVIRIAVHPGDYRMTNTVQITSKLNGLSIIGAGASDVRFKGTMPLDLSWKKFDGEIYVSDAAPDMEFDQLVVNDQLQILARYPNYDEDGGDWQGHAADAVSKERLASWAKPEGAVLHVMHSGRWGGFHYQVMGVNEEGEAILEGGFQNNRPSKPHPEYRMVENVFEELDSPGEWYFDANNKKLYYWPIEDLDMQTAKFEGVILKSFFELKGDYENPVKDVSIEGIKFEYAQRTFMESYEPLLRSDWTIYRGGAVYLESTENCTVADCEFVNLGGNVIFASRYNKGLVVKGNHIHDCGASAVCFVGDSSAVRSPSFQYGEFVPLAEIDTVRGPKNELYPRECLVEDNLIYRIGRIEKQTAGVQISMATDITVSHNSIYDVPRAGINIGDGTWGGHIIEYNDVFNTVLETGDHGSFNSWGRDRFWHPNRKVMDSITLAFPDMPYLDAVNTTVIRNNRFRCDHGWDIDLDDGSSNYHIYNNLCLNGGIKLREGFYRVVENNIMVNNSFHPHVWFEYSGDVFKHNIVADAYQDVRLDGWGLELDYNLFPNEESLMKSQIYNRDMNSAFGDPLFKDPANLDFTVTENSPALALGFKNFPMDRFGVQKPELKAIAKAPEVPVITVADDDNEQNSPVVAWLRNNIKSVDTEQEQSAYGLNTTEGVIILSVWSGSPAAQNNGLKKGDVILEVEGIKITNTINFLKITKNYQDSGEINIVVMRNQQEQPLKILIE